MKFVKDFIKIKYTNNDFHKNWIDFLKDIDRSICSINNEYCRSKHIYKYA